MNITRQADVGDLTYVHTCQTFIQGSCPATRDNIHYLYPSKEGPNMGFKQELWEALFSCSLGPACFCWMLIWTKFNKAYYI